MDDPAPSTAPPSTVPQVRSRITVVCAECKRLKLKCDRRTPCGSCTKRDTVSRCIYSPAAAEKVDLHSINNRLIQVEALLSMITAGKTPPPFQSSYPLAQVPLTTSHSATARPSHVAISSTPSPISIRIDDLVNIWLAHCQLDIFTAGDQAPFNSETPLDGPYVKLEQPPIELRKLSGSYSDNTIIIDESQSADTTTTGHSLPPLHLYHTTTTQRFSSPSAPSGQPSATPAVFSHLPPPTVRTRLLTSARSVSPDLSLLIHWNRVAELADPAAVAAAREEREHQKTLANAVFFGARAGSRSPSPMPVAVNGSGASLPLFACMCYLLALGAVEPASDPSVDHAFLCSLAGQAMAVWEEFTTSTDVKEENVASDSVDVSADVSTTQAEKEKEDLDYVLALLLQVKYLLRVGHLTPSKDPAETVFPLIGKLVNTARGIGLARDPEEEVGVRRSIKVDERRRAIWWDIMFYDTFTSDVLEHAPILSTYSYTTRIPAIAQTSPSHSHHSRNESGDAGDESDLSDTHGDEEVSEKRPVSSKYNGPLKGRIPSRLLPPSKSKSKAKTLSPEQDTLGTGFFGVRCRLTRLAQGLKHRLASPGCDCCSCGSGYTLDQAARIESEVRTWAADLPSSLRLEAPSSTSSPDPKSQKHTAIAAELSILANRMIIAAYVPLMRPSQDGASSSTPSVYSAAHPWSPASRATVDAAQGVTRAARVLHRLVYAGSGPPFMGGYYSFQKAVADALVVCAHSGFASTKSSGRTAVLMEEVRVALEVLDATGLPNGQMTRLLASLRRRVEAGDPNKRSDSNVLKRKHIVLEGAAPAEHSAEDVSESRMAGERQNTLPTPPPQRQPSISPTPQTRGSVSRGKGSDKKQGKKGYSAYPAIGFRDRGKDNAPWMAKKTNSAPNKRTQNEASEFTSSPPADDANINYQLSTQQVPLTQHAIQHVIDVDNGYRSRSSSISQAPRSQAVDYSAQYVKEQDEDMHTSQRRRFTINDAGQHQQHDQHPDPAQQSFVVPSPAHYIPALQSSRAGSFEAPHSHDQHHRSFDQGSNSSDNGVYGSPTSPYPISSAPLSAASSPYGSSTGHPPQTPATYAPHHPNTSVFVPQPTTPSPHGYYHMSSGYEAPYEGEPEQVLGVGTMSDSSLMQNHMAVGEVMAARCSVPPSPIYEKAQQQAMYEDVKIPVEHNQQQMHHYQLASERTTPIDHVPMNVSAPQAWAPNPQYMQSHQPLVEQQDAHYWTTSQAYYQ
ncbi:hypothetical protein DXG01_006063 [Tephrocybe rancida]|nr:hypothetical protein DXG01_006063 [Tephrocybe rancida]